MSERGIAVGDLVQIIRTSECGCTGGLGLVFEVAEISFRGGSYCRNCKRYAKLNQLVAFLDLSTFRHVELRRLKRIPPLVEPESTTQTDEVTV